MELEDGVSDRPAPPDEERADAPPADPSAGGRPDLAALLAECKELERRYPPTDLPTVAADARWADEAEDDGRFEPYRGKYVAVADRRVRATGDTDLEARVVAAREYGCHPSRLFVRYIDPPVDWW